MHDATRPRRRGALIALALLLVGQACAPTTPRWVKRGVTARELDADRQQCLAQSQDYFPTGDTRTNYVALDQCMARKGYTVSREP